MGKDSDKKDRSPEQNALSERESFNDDVELNVLLDNFDVENVVVNEKSSKHKKSSKRRAKDSTYKIRKTLTDINNRLDELNENSDSSYVSEVSTGHSNHSRSKRRKLRHSNTSKSVDLTNDGVAFQATKLQQLSSAHCDQLSSENIMQPRSVVRTGNSDMEGIPDDTVSLHPNDDLSALSDNEVSSIIDTLNVCGDEETLGPPIHQAWADKVLKAWDTKQTYTSIKNVHEKYKLPSNCAVVKPPKMNIEMWRLLDKWQKKSDLQFSGIQKTLTKVVAATLNLTEINMSPGTSKDVRTRSMQVALDMVTTYAYQS